MSKKIIIFIAVLVLTGLIFAGCSSKTDLKPPTSSDKAKKGPQTFVPANTTPEKYLEKYYTFYQQKKWKEAYKLLPAESKAKRTEKEFEQRNESMPLKSFKVIKKEQQKTSMAVTVRMVLEGQPAGFDKWDTQWIFIKHSKGWLVSNYQVAVAK
ncbi:MAG: hypothetical protein C4562_03295 [Actinobacteria bacterium]|nr:MAG: hypothetical protein C4562_03295 [Actinomycetota bacterium]